jgi:hypothetical protein
MLKEIFRKQLIPTSQLHSSHIDLEIFAPLVPEKLSEFGTCTGSYNLPGMVQAHRQNKGIVWQRRSW